VFVKYRSSVPSRRPGSPIDQAIDEVIAWAEWKGEGSDSAGRDDRRTSCGELRRFIGRRTSPRADASGDTSPQATEGRRPPARKQNRMASATPGAGSMYCDTPSRRNGMIAGRALIFARDWVINDLTAMSPLRQVRGGGQAPDTVSARTKMAARSACASAEAADEDMFRVGLSRGASSATTRGQRRARRSSHPRTVSTRFSA